MAKIFLSIIFLTAPLYGADVSTHAFGRKAGPTDTGQIIHYSTAASDDSNWNPAATQPSFTIYNPVGISSVTVDNRTGLMWITNPRTDAGFGTGKNNWESALTSCTVTLNGMAYAGYTDWRLPNVRELMSIQNFANSGGISVNTSYFPGAYGNYYWTSTTYRYTTTQAWVVSQYSGAPTPLTKTQNWYVICVRGGP